MVLVAEQNDILGRITEDSPEIGWYLQISFMDGGSRDYLQDTKEMAVLQAEEDFGISSTAWKETEEIYIYLCNEGTHVWRAVDAVQIEKNVYKIPLDAEVPEDEEWEFDPGSILKCCCKKLADGERLVAVERCQLNNPGQMN